MGRPSLAPGRYLRLLLLGTSRGWTRNGRSRGGRPIRWACVRFCTWLRLRRLRTIRRSRGRGGCFRSRRIRRCSRGCCSSWRMQVSGIEMPTAAALARFDRKRNKKTSNKKRTHPHDPDAKVAKMKDGRTYVAHKAEHAVDLETGAVVGVTIQGADTGDTTTMVEPVIAAAEQVEAVLPTEAWDGGGGGGQGLPQQRDDGGLGRGACPQLYRGAGSGPPVLEGRARSSGSGVCEPPSDTGQSGPGAAAASWRVGAASVRASI